MALTTNTELKAAVADWINRSDLTTQIVDFISIAEARMARAVKTNELHTTTTLTIDAQTEALPADFAGMVFMRIQGNQFPSLDYMPSDTFWSRYASNEVGRPIAYTIQGNSIYFMPSPDATYTADYTYVAKPDIATDATNRMLTVHPDLYLFGALSEANSFINDDAGFAKYEGKFLNAVDSINSSDVYKGALSMQLENVV